ncbi:MAG TPA: hypothetical protein VKA67_03545, partial [Verrucomicrobiae bacterium]|nr:hypothetical protein [Verrucomicrobiae bacterium]
MTLLLSVALQTGCAKPILSLATNWTAKDPNPQVILDEAEADAKNGNYTNALAKQIWIYDNSLKYEPAFAGVRLSFALQDWIHLGKVYPPALEKLKAVRDKAGENAGNMTGQKLYEAFEDFEAINNALGQDVKTKELFSWLDSNKLVEARDVFNLAEPALVKSKAYRLCGKYINADASFAQALQSYRMTSKIAKSPKLGQKVQDFAEKKFENTTTTIIALLVVND